MNGALFKTLLPHVKNLIHYVQDNTSSPNFPSSKPNVPDLPSNSEALADPFCIRDKYGNSIPDFSTCGYAGGGVPLPQIPVVLTLNPSCNGLDDTARIQRAIDDVSRKPLCNSPPVSPIACRGAVYLTPGEYRVSTALTISTQGVVLRGAGPSTVILATGKAKRNLIDIGLNSKNRRTHPTSKKIKILDPHLRVGASSLHLTEPIPDLNPGDPILISRPAPQEWIHSIGMDRIPERPKSTTLVTQWDPAHYTLNFERIVTKVYLDNSNHQCLHFDPPLVMDICDKFGSGLVYKYRWDPEPPVSHIGVENLSLVSEFKCGCEDKDEDHCTLAVSLDHCRDCWVTDVESRHFVNGYMLGYHARNCTIQDCLFLHPVSSVTGGRRYGFHINGSQNLVRRCHSRFGRHAFVTGSKVCGPSAFVDCTSENDLSDSGPHHRWATGILYDRVRAGEINCRNRGWMGSGHGWSGAFHVYWNCESSRNTFQSPPNATNWVIGHIGKDSRPPFPQEGTEPQHHSKGVHVNPSSLYEWQLSRRGK